MATISTPPADYPPEIIGYVDPWIASPGDMIAVKVSSTEPEYVYRAVRLIQGVEIDHSPLGQEEEISTIPGGKGNGRFQLARPGSYALIEDWTPPAKEKGLDISLFMQSHLPESGDVQTVISTLDVEPKSGFALIINEAGKVDFWVGTGKIVDVITTDFQPVKKGWAEVHATIDGTTFEASLTPIAYFAEKPAPPVDVQAEMSGVAVLFKPGPITFAASYAESPTSAFPRATNFFNRRIDSPTFKTVGDSPRILVKYDFAREMTSDGIVDISGSEHHGILVNAPTRAVKGYDWDGSEPDWTKAKHGYGAIHFHDDDLDDAAWETDFTITIPADVRSSAYAIDVKSTNGKASDMITFFIRPTKAAKENLGEKVAFIISTFTYLAYANERLCDPTKSSSIDVGPGFDKSTIAKGEEFHRMERRKDLGLSNYDVHNDDSGVVFSSAKRLILNVRLGYIMWAIQRPREFSADLIMIGLNARVSRTR